MSFLRSIFPIICSTRKPNRSRTSKSDDVKSSTEASAMKDDDDRKDKDADVSAGTGYDASDDNSSEEENEGDYSDEESD